MSGEMQSDETVQTLPDDSDGTVDAQVETEDQSVEQAEEQTEEQNDENPDDSETNVANNSKPILYNLNISPVVRCVKIVARLINLELELRYD